VTTRRAILAVGAASVAIAAAGAAGFALTRAPEKAREPWRRAGESFGDWRLDALAYAILAPNPHNMQPWRVRLDGDAETGGLTVFADPARLLPQTDPFNRQIVVGFGAFLELFAQAAMAKGRAVDMIGFPEGAPAPTLDARPIAIIAASARPTSDEPLFAQTIRRRTNRAPFAARPVPRAGLAAIVAETIPGVTAFAVDDAERVAALKAIAREAWEIEWRLAPTRRESIAVTRIGKAEINARPFGLALGGAPIEALAAIGVLTRAAMDDPDSTAFAQSLEFYRRAVDSAAAFLVATTPANTRAEQLAAGAAWLRLHQAAAREGLAFHPLSQALQEFPEMAGPYGRAHALLAPDGACVQMLARIGYAGDPEPAPREPLEARLIAAR
jgi:hypothetical protein